MASPFSKYTGEQVPQTNILPATTEMARQRYESIANFGKEIGGAIEKYGLKNQERVKNSMFASGIIGKFLEAPEELTDEQDRPNPPVLSETAPAHIKQLYKKAESEGDGDWVAGLSGVSGLELEAFLGLQSKYEKEEEVKFNRDLQTRGIQLQEAGHQLQLERFKVEARATEVNIESAVFNLQRAKATAATQDELTQIDLGIKKLMLKYEEQVGPEKAKAFMLDLEGRRLQVKGLQRAEDAATALDEVKAAVVPQTKTLTYEATVPKVYGQYEINGEAMDSFDLEAAIKTIDPSLTLKDIDGDGVLDAIAPQIADAVPVNNQIARKMTGDNKFVVSDRAADTGSTLNSKFIDAVYNELIRMYPSKKASIDAQFKINTATGKINKDTQNWLNPAEQYAVAKKWFDTPSIQSALAKKYGAVAVEQPVSKVKILYTNSYDDTVQKSETYQLSEQAVWDAKIDSVRASFAKAGKPFTLDNRDVYKAVNLYGGYMPVTMPNGVQGFVSPKGEFMSMAQFNELGVPSSLPKTEWESKRNIHNRFLQDYAAVVVKGADGKVSIKGGQETDTGYTIGFLTRDPKNPINDARATDFGKTEETITQLKRDLNKADVFVDRMMEMWDEATGVGGFIDVVVGAWTGGKWNKEYTANQRGLETFRKYFIAPGTETEKDAQRLADLMSEPSFQGWRNKDVSKQVLELARSLVIDGIRIEAESKGFFVNAPEGKGVPSADRMSKEQRQAVLQKIADLTGNTLPSTESKKK
jgi:hypothetical protein